MGKKTTTKDFCVVQLSLAIQDEGCKRILKRESYPFTRVGNIYILYVLKKLNIVAHGHMEYGWLGLQLAADQGRGHDPEKHQREVGTDGATSERRKMLALSDRGERKCTEYLQILVCWSRGATLALLAWLVGDPFRPQHSPRASICNLHVKNKFDYETHHVGSLFCQLTFEFILASYTMIPESL
jgi:hypothetical protein